LPQRVGYNPQRFNLGHNMRSLWIQLGDAAASRRVFCPGPSVPNLLTYVQAIVNDARSLFAIAINGARC
jgi:hypothetical protein